MNEYSPGKYVGREQTPEEKVRRARNVVPMSEAGSRLADKIAVQTEDMGRVVARSRATRTAEEEGWDL